MDMGNANENNHAGYPLARILTLGEFAIEQPVTTPSPAPGQLPRYAPVPPGEWRSRGPAVTLLKVLLCRPNRRAARDELIEAIWPDNEALNAAHALDSAASVLRRHILRTHGEGSLLLTVRSGGETIFRLPGQRHLWVDADELLELAARTVRAECQGRDPLPLLEAAHALSRGEFLEDDPYAEWAQGRRRTVEGARHRVLYRLVDLYLGEARAGLAEELLFAELERDQADEDALCRLMVLLVDQGRRQEALRLYQYTAEVLREERSEPAMFTKELAARIRQGLTLRERTAGYTVGGAQPTRSADRATRPALAVIGTASPNSRVTKKRPVKAYLMYSEQLEGERRDA
jgi:DNA-binding SARP family transcriptional activator